MIEIAKRAAARAGRKVLFVRPRGLSPKSKERYGDFATEADLLSEKLILEELQNHFPDYNYLSEEAGRSDNGSEFTWVIDPLDGTIPYTAGLSTFAISIGLLKRFQPVLGVINMPESGLMFWAESGKGAYMNGKRISVSDKSELLKSVVGIDMGYVGSRKAEIERFLVPVADKVRYMPMLGSASVGAAYVACRFLDGYMHSAHPWDYAAGGIIVEEAGGTVTDYQGKPIDWSKDWIDFIASNGHIHEKILSLI